MLNGTYLPRGANRLFILCWPLYEAVPAVALIIAVYVSSGDFGDDLSALLLITDYFLYATVVT